MIELFSSSNIEMVGDSIESNFRHHFYILLKAIELVDYVKYVSNANNYAKKDDAPNMEIRIGQLVERTFAYELYRQWLNLLEYEKSDLTVNAEIAKEMPLMTNKKAFSDIMNGKTKYPDLVLHRSHNNLKDNTFVCEIKRYEGLNHDNLVYDITKLCGFLSHKIWENNPYKYGVFIVIRGSLKCIEEKWNENRATKEKGNNKNNHNKLFSKIICISYNDNEIEYDTLYNILKDKEKRQ